MNSLLQAMIHVSTAYSFCIESKIEEKVYDEFMDYQEIMNQLLKMSDEEMEEKKKEYVEDLKKIPLLMFCVEQTMRFIFKSNFFPG